MRRIRKGCKWDGRRWAKFEVTLPGTLARRRRRVKAATLADVEKLYAEFRNEVLNPNDIIKPVEALTFEGYTREHWPISRDKRRPLSPEVAYREWSALTSRIFPAIGRLRFDQITENVIEDFAAGLLLRKCKPATKPAKKTRPSLYSPVEPPELVLLLRGFFSPLGFPAKVSTTTKSCGVLCCGGWAGGAVLWRWPRKPLPSTETSCAPPGLSLPTETPRRVSGGIRGTHALRFAR